MTAENPDLVYQFADDRIEMAVGEQTVIADGQLLESITPTQFDIMATFARKPDNIFPWATLAQRILGTDDDTLSRAALRQHVIKIRRQLGSELGDVQEGAIRAKPGIGYYAVSSLAGTLEVSDQDDSVRRSMADDRLVIHLDKWRVTLDNKVLELTPTEYRLLNRLSRQPDNPVSVSTLCNDIFGRDDERARLILRTHLKKIRYQLGTELGDRTQGALRSAFGKGYYVVSSLDNDPVRDNSTTDSRVI